MHTRAFATGLGACLALAGCGGGGGGGIASASAAQRRTEWRNVATDADRDRLRGWRDTWAAAMAKARAGGKGAQIDALGALVDPDRALGNATPPAGAYRCRVYKIGAVGTAMSDFTAYPQVDCMVGDDGGLPRLAKTEGSQRPAGLLFADGDARDIFLGTMVLSDETKARGYGQDPLRDMAGYVERIGDKRWRLVLPNPRFESMLDIIDIVPAP